MSSNTYDSVIVGGGIAGLYTAYHALKRNPNRKIILLEKEDRLGGRIYTYQEDDFPVSIEYGAGRFHRGHKQLFRLINELELKDKVKPISPMVESAKMKELMEIIIDKYQNRKNDQDIQLSLKDYVLKHTFVSPSDMNYIESYYGYSAELIIMNMKDAMVLIEDMRSNSYYYLQDGLSQIITRLEKFLRKMKCKILKNTPIKTIKQIAWDDQIGFNIHTDSGDEYMAKKCVLAVPKTALQSFTILKPIKDKLNSIVTTPLCRIYALYDHDSNGDIWFQRMQKQTIPNYLRMIIPQNQEKGVIMNSYTDDKYAKWWYNLWKREGIPSVKYHLCSMIKKVFPWANINLPRRVKIAYWNAGVAFWKPGVKNSEVLAKDISRPLGNHIELYICGENYSPKQQWIESALITCPLKI